MADLSTVLPVLAALLNLSGFTLYNIQAKLGKSDPNPASWFLWAFFATLNALSFRAMNDTIAALQFFAGSVGCIATLLYVLMIGRFRWPTRREWVMLVIGLVAIFVWRQYTATAANMILAGMLLWSFEPTLRGVWCDPTKEKATAWYLWASAFAITGVNTFVFKGGWTLSMVVPIVGFVCHIAVPPICTEKRKIAYEKARDPWWGWFPKKCPQCGSEEKCHGKVISTAWDTYLCEECGYNDTVYVGFGTI